MDPCYASWASWLHGRWQRDDRPVRTVLDVCCGTGLLAVELRRLGYDVAGTDASPDMLARARDRLGGTAALAAAVLPDLPADPAFRGPFDAAVSTFDGLNYLEPGDFAASLAAVAGRLRPGGWCVFDLHTDAMMRFTRDHPVVADDAPGATFVITSDVDVAARTVVTRLEMGGSAAGEAFAEVHRQWFHTDTDVRAALAAAGLDLLDVVAEYTDAPVGPDSLRATWVARRR